MRQMVKRISMLFIGVLSLSLLSLPLSVQTLPAQQARSPLRGSAKAVLGPVNLGAGLVVVRGRSNGTANFSISLVTQDAGKAVTDSYANRYLMIDAVGTYNGASAAILRQDGSYYIDITLASGPYELTVEQPSPSTAQPVSQQQFSGKGQQVTPVFTLPAGSYTVTAQSDNPAVRVWLFQIDDLGGAAVLSSLTGYYGSELIDTTIPPSYTSVPIEFPTDGLYLAYVNPGGSGMAAWSLAVQ